MREMNVEQFKVKLVLSALDSSKESLLESVYPEKLEFSS